MSEIDPHTSQAIAQLRRDWSPPSGAEERMLADFHARLGAGPPDGGGSEPGDLPGGDGGLASSAAQGQWIWAAKIVAAVAGLTGAGLGGVVLVAKLVVTPTRAPAPTRAPVTEPSEAPTEAPTPTAAVVGEPEVPAPAESKSPKPRARAQPSREPSVDLAAELALIRQARTAPPAQALALLDRHAAEFSTGALASEREALRAVAYCALDRLADARAAVDRLDARDPGPLLRERVRSACGKKIELPTTDLDGPGHRSQ